MTVFDLEGGQDWLLDGFAPVSLDDLNRKAEMLARIDNKYVVRREALQPIMAELSDDFEILEIDRCRAFTYRTRYFDDERRSAYYEHHQGLRKGFKVRVRRYEDTGLCFLEVKVKGKRGQTVKNRLPYDARQLDGLSRQALDFVRSTYSDHYGKPFVYDLRPALDLRYRRITLVAKDGRERMTIDTGLAFRGGHVSVDVGQDVFIVETKSELGRGVADSTFRRAGQRSTKKCSKYCIGMALTGQIERWNRFLPTMRKLGVAKGEQRIAEECPASPRTTVALQAA
jgi:hypothetical protein